MRQCSLQIRTWARDRSQWLYCFHGTSSAIARKPTFSVVPGFHPSFRIRALSINFRGVPSGLPRSNSSTPVNATVSAATYASSRILAVSSLHKSGHAAPCRIALRNPFFRAAKAMSSNVEDLRRSAINALRRMQLWRNGIVQTQALVRRFSHKWL